MTIRIKYFRDASGAERVRISGNNGEPMFTSEGYETRDSAENAIMVLDQSFSSGDVIIESESESESRDESRDEMEISESEVSDVSEILREER